MKSLLAILMVFVFVGCQKNDPTNNPEYIGSWSSYDTSSSLFSNHSNIMLVINADGSAYDTWGDGANGKCKIKNGYIKIDNDHKHAILEAPHSVPLLTLEESPFDTVKSSTKMRLRLGDGSFFHIFKSEVDFYKIE